MIIHSQYIGWPDHGIPASTDGFLTLVDNADSFNHTKGPIVVHCRFCQRYDARMIIPVLELEEVAHSVSSMQSYRS